MVIEVVERLSKRGRNCCRSEDCADRLDRPRASNLSSRAAVQFEATWEATVTNSGGFGKTKGAFSHNGSVERTDK